MWASAGTGSFEDDAYFQFTIDFTTPNSLMWATNCTYAVTNNSCSEAPTNVNLLYDGTNFGTKWLRSFQNMWWGGYNVTGSVYLT